MRGVRRTESRGAFETFAPQARPSTGGPLGWHLGVPLTTDGARFENRGSISSPFPGPRTRLLAAGFARNAVSEEAGAAGLGVGFPGPTHWASALSLPRPEAAVRCSTHALPYSPLSCSPSPLLHSSWGSRHHLLWPDRGVPPLLRLVKRRPRTRPHLPDRGLEAPQTAALDHLVKEDSGRGGVQQLQVIVETNQQSQPVREGKGPWQSWGTQRRPLGTDGVGGQSSCWAPGSALSPSPPPCRAGDLSAPFRRRAQ